MPEQLPEQLPEQKSLDNVSVVGGKLIREVPSSRLDNIIARGTARVTSLTARIAKLEQERTDCQAHVDQAAALKIELEK